MSNPKKKPEYNPEEIQQEIIELVKHLYLDNSRDDGKRKKNTLKSVAEEVGISISKTTKLLITGGVYMPATAKRVNALNDAGLTVPEIQGKLGVSWTTVQTYLPYKKGVYSTKETSVNADRIRVYRERCQRVDALSENMDEESLWNAIVSFQEYPFYTVSGLPFSYVLKQGRDGAANKELVISRRAESKTLAWSSVMLAFNNALDTQGQAIDCPKALGDIRGISYIYPMLYRFGIIEVPEMAAEKMQLKGGAQCLNGKRKGKENEG